MDDLEEIEVVRFGTNRPSRVLVRFVADDREGREEWVPPARLKVLWSDRTPFIEREQRWDAVRRLGPGRDSPPVDAAEIVFDSVPDWQYASQGWNRDAGVLQVRDLDGLSADLGLEHQAITGHPLTFLDGDVLIAPWPVTETVAQLLAERLQTFC